MNAHTCQTTRRADMARFLRRCRVAYAHLYRPERVRRLHAVRRTLNPKRSMTHPGQWLPAILLLILSHGQLAAQTVTLGGAEVTNVEWHDGPTARHRSIYRQVVRCLGVTDAPPAASVRWGVVDAIVHRGRQLYGMALVDPRTVVVERAVRNHPGVLSHEVGHLFDLDEHDPELIRCTIPSTTGLPRRTS